MAPGAVLDGRQRSPGKVVASWSPVVASSRQLMADFL
ncbi:hypothetical protein A2U01_0090036, partial [Trifolium medium]|nr:hypothetical protein [Trifolium medium]